MSKLHVLVILVLETVDHIILIISPELGSLFLPSNFFNRWKLSALLRISLQFTL